VLGEFGFVVIGIVPDPMIARLATEVGKKSSPYAVLFRLAHANVN